MEYQSSSYLKTACILGGIWFVEVGVPFCEGFSVILDWDLDYGMPVGNGPRRGEGEGFLVFVLSRVD